MSRKFMLAWIKKIVVVALVGGFVSCRLWTGAGGKENSPRFTVLSKDPAWVLDTTTALQCRGTKCEPMLR